MAPSPFAITGTSTRFSLIVSGLLLSSERPYGSNVLVMHAIVVDEPGGPDALTWQDVPDPRPAPDEVVIEVAAAGVNRADVAQRQGVYPPPPGASEIIGLECSGRIAEVGAEVDGWSVGDEVCALLAGGGYAERVAVPAGQVMPVPDGVSLVEAAGLPEVACTVYSTVFMHAGLASGETLLVHGGASGIGTFAIQLAHARGIRVLCTAGSEEKLARCRELGADAAINYRTEDFVQRVRDETGGRGADVILDIMGAPYLDRNISALAPDGRLVVIGMQGGGTGELNLGKLLVKRCSVYSAGLRGRPVEQKATITRAVRAEVWPLVADGTVRPIIDRTVPLAEARDAHGVMEAGDHVGKIILTT
jgi:putative PIG3 family NAD(P)H quinone oxidoreductase